MTNPNYFKEAISLFLLGLGLLFLVSMIKGDETLSEEVLLVVVLSMLFPWLWWKPKDD